MKNSSSSRPAGGAYKARAGSALPFPTKQLVSRDQFAALDPSHWLIQRKYDGDFHCLRLSARDNSVGTVLCEKMKPKSGGIFTAADRAMFQHFPDGFFVALTIESMCGQNLLHEPNAWRLELLRALHTKIAAERPDIILADTLVNFPPATFHQQLSIGSEGLVAHPCGGAWGPMLCYKRGEIFLVRVTKLWGGKSVEFHETGHSVMMRGQLHAIKDRVHPAHGRVPVSAQVADQLKIGSVIRVEGLGQTDDHKIREPKLCREWLVHI